VKKREQINIQEYQFIIEKAIKRLPDGGHRFMISNYPLDFICLNGFRNPDLDEQLRSDYGLSSGNEDVEKDYYEEIMTIEKIMIEENINLINADWQSDLNLDIVERLWKPLNRYSYAIQLWDTYSIPWRYKNGLIYLIHSPSDILGTPIIYDYTVKNFLIGLIVKEENKSIDIEKLLGQLKFWKTSGQIFIIILFFVLVSLMALLK